MKVLDKILSSLNGQKQIAVLVDPDKSKPDTLRRTIQMASDAKVDYVFVGGSLLFGSMESAISVIKSECSIPLVIFPGNVMQVTGGADAILFLSLISGRNPEFLIGHHVLAAPGLKSLGMEVIPAGYMLIENGSSTSVEYMSNTTPIPAHKPEIAIATALAGEMLGMKILYLEAGSGASKPVGVKLISEVRQNISIPLIVGGGVKNPAEMEAIYRAGANIIVVGTAVEEHPESIMELAAARSLF